MKTIASVFPTLSAAGLACSELERLGIPREDISIIAGNDASRHDEYLERAQKASATTTSAAAGAASVGGGIGIIAMLGVMAIPGVGPILALGPMLTVLAGMGFGATTGGLIGAFHNMGIEKEQAPLYEEAVRRGEIMVAAVVDEQFEEAAVNAMRRNGARDIRDEKDTWAETEWSGPAHDPHPYVSNSSIGEENG